MMQRILSLLLGLALLDGCGRDLPASGGVQASSRRLSPVA